MSAIGAYISACRFVFQSNVHDAASWSELERHLRALRAQLTCCVCGLILQHAVGPSHSVCSHHTCESCREGKMRLRPSCGWCGDRKEFVSNPQLDILVQSHRKLCEYLASFDLKCDSLSLLLREGSSLDETGSGSEFPAMSLPAPAAPVVETPRKRGKSGRKRKRGERNSLKVRINLQGGDGEGSSHFVHDSCHSRLVETHENEVTTTTLTPEEAESCDPVDEVPHSTTGILDTEGSFESLNHTDLVESMDEIETHDLGSYGEISDSTFRDIYSTVAVEHDYINRGVLGEDENGKEHRKYKSKGPLVTIIKKAKIVGLNNIVDSVDSTPQPLRNKQSRGLKKGTGCRCGLATPNPGKLTCCGQRCPCYSAFKGCVDCRCRGCRNPRGDITKQTMSPLLGAQSKEDSEVESEIKID